MNLLNNSWQFIQQYWMTIILSTVICGLFFSIGAVPEKLYFNQEAIVNGEVWRLFTAHIVHSDVEHLIWNLCALIILSLLIEQEHRLVLFTSLLTGIISIDYYLWFNSTGIVNYAGFSGVLNTLLVVALFQQLQKNKADITNTLNNKSYQLFFYLLAIIIYIASLLKIVIEILSQQTIFSHISWQAVPQVHLTGFMAGTILVIIFNRLNLLHNNE